MAVVDIVNGEIQLVFPLSRFPGISHSHVQAVDGWQLIAVPFFVRTDDGKETEDGQGILMFFRIRNCYLSKTKVITETRANAWIA